MPNKTRELTPFILIISMPSLLLSSCGAEMATEVAFSPTPVVTSTDSSQSVGDGIRTMPLLYWWEISDKPVITSDEFSLALHVLIVETNSITAIYTLSGISSDEFFDKYQVEIIDDANNTSRLKSNSYSKDIESLTFGEMEFEPRFHSEKLFLSVTNDNTDAKVEIAELKGDTQKYNYDLIFSLPRPETLKQNGFNITFNGWYLMPEAMPTWGAATPTPESILDYPLMDLPNGVTIEKVASLVIERVEPNNRYDVGLQLLSDHTFFYTINGSVNKSISTPASQIEAYPGP